MNRKAFAKGIAKYSLILFAVFFTGFLVVNYVIPAMSEGETSIWTDKADYSPEETVLISGSGFYAASESNPVQIKITRPDGDVTVCPDKYWCPNPLPTTSSFSDYAYILNGIEGTYTVFATDGSNSATTIFTDCPCRGAIWTTRDDCGDTTQNENHFGPGEKVYINGNNFETGIWNWDITGQPGSCDSNVVVASGTVNIGLNGKFCILAYTVQSNDCGTYKFTVKKGSCQKQDNYGVVCVDRDKDGYDVGPYPGCPKGNDCDDTNPNVHPGATEVCNDGIDNDCDGKTDCADSDCNGNPACNLCGNNLIDYGEQCELPNTNDNSYCNQTTGECSGYKWGTSSGYKWGTRDDYGNCNANCGCVLDSFTNYQCSVSQCQAPCDSEGGCQPGQICDLDNCQCVGTPWECQTDDECDGLDKNYCDGTLVKHDEGRCVNYECKPETTTVKNCDDGLYCNGEETCSDAECVAGTPVHCNDGVGCTIDSCNEGTDSCDNIPDNSLCDDGNSCTVDVCDVKKGCTYTGGDTTGPITSDVVVTPYFNNGLFNTTAKVEDECSNIKTAKYYIGHSLIGSCNEFVAEKHGTIYPLDDGTFDLDKLIEHVGGTLFYNRDGLNYICIEGQDTSDNWGNCACAYFETDVIPPKCPYDIYLDSTLNPREYLVCGNNTWLNASVCDEESFIQGGEYFLNINWSSPDPIPEPWSGVWMNVLKEFTGSEGSLCAVIGALVNTSQLSDGTHYINIRGKDSVENWGKISGCRQNISFIKDTLPPKTSKQLNPAGGIKFECDIEEINGKTITDGCYYVKQGTTITLNATDPDPQKTGEFAGNVVIYYKVWWSYNGSSWTLDQQGQSSVNQPVTITLSKDSYHLIEYWSVDACGWEEEHHFELDIVDGKPPVTKKTISLPKVKGDDNPINWYIKSDTKIELTCTDQEPHPVGDVTLYWDIYYSESCTSPIWEWKNGGKTDGYKLISGLKDSCHKIVYHCEDGLGNKENNVTEIDAVDNQAPTITKTIIGPQFQTEDKLYIDGITKIRVESTDQEPHPVGQVTCDWDYVVTDGTKTGQGQTGVTPPFDISFPEESTHVLTITCKDALNNTATNSQTYIVDKTPPTTTKTYGTPYVTYEGKKWINSSTPITLTVEDTGQHKSGIKETKYRVTLVGDGNCTSQAACSATNGTGSWNTYKSPFTIAQDSCHLIEYYSVDNVDKTETVKKQCVYVDNKAPVSNKTVGEPKKNVTATCDSLGQGTFTDGCYYVTQQTPITLTCQDQQPHPVDNVKIYYKIDWKNESDDTWIEGSWEEDSNSVTFTYPKDSYHRLSWYCVDALGNREQTHTELDIVDTKPPRTTKTISLPKVKGDDNPINWYINNDTKIELTCTDQEPHPVGNVTLYWDIYYSSESCTSPIWEWKDGGTTSGYKLISELEDSCHKIVYHCEDALGNAETEKVEIDAVDNKAPTITKTIIGPQFYNQAEDKLYIDGITKIRVESTDPKPHPVGQVTCDYSYVVQETQQTGGETNLIPPFNISFPEESTHVLTITCKDALGNTRTNIQTYIVDKTPPTTTKTYGTPYVTYDDKKWISSSTPITLTVEDTGQHKSGIKETKYRVTLVGDGNCTRQADCEGAVGSGEWSIYTSPFTIAQDSCHLIEYYSVDNVDKTETVKKQCVYVDNKAPEGTKTVGKPNIPCGTDGLVDGDFPPGEQCDDGNTNNGDGCSSVCLLEEKECDYWVRGNVTQITLDCNDPQPHPVGQEKMCYRITFDGIPSDLTQQYCLQFGGNMEGDWCCVEKEKLPKKKLPYTFTFQEDSLHNLEYYCVDALENKNKVDIELFKVDSTPPVSTKEITGPKWWNGKIWWVTSDTQFSITAVDQKEPCAVGVAGFYVKIEWDSDCDGTVDTVIFEGEILEPYQYNFTLNEECLHKITWYAIDLLGNEEEASVQYHKVDNTPPEVFIIKPVNGWYEYWDTIPIVAFAQDVTNKTGPCKGNECAVGIENRTQCYAYLVDAIPFQIFPLDSTFLTYNANNMQCEGYAILNTTGIPEGDVGYLVVTVGDRLGNADGQLREIIYAYHNMTIFDFVKYMKDNYPAIGIAKSSIGNYKFARWLNPTWDYFFLPELVLDDIYGNVPHYPEIVLASLNRTGTPSYKIVWYYNGTEWLSYEPDVPPMVNDLKEFNDRISNPYWIKMKYKDLLGIPYP